MSQQRRGNPDLRRAVTTPAPSNEALEGRLRDWVSPGTFAGLKTVQDKGRHHWLILYRCDRTCIGP